VAIAPLSLIQGALFQYVSFDYMWWVIIAYLTLRLLNTQNERYWLAIGAVIGLGMMTKYTMAFLVAGIVVGVLATQARRYLTSVWLWGGVLLSLLIFLPNFIWQAENNFISLTFLQSIHARDVEIGRTDGYLIEQLIVCANPFTLPFWLMGLYYYCFTPAGARYRLLAYMYIVPFLLLLLAKGRSYYLAAAYPMLLAAGVVVWQEWITKWSAKRVYLLNSIRALALALGGIIFVPIMLPLAPINSQLWHLTRKIHDNFVEQIGWQDLTEIVANVYNGLPEAARAQTVILTGNYGEAGAINLYGKKYGLPTAISGTNSYWLRGYGDAAAETVIVLGYSTQSAKRIFETCAVVATVSNRYGVENEETTFHKDILLCHKPRQPWPILWQSLKRFG
jgi:hypothetical protein